MILLSLGFGISDISLNSNGNTKLILSDDDDDDVITGDVIAIFIGCVITGAVIAIGTRFSFSGLPKTPMYLANTRNESPLSLYDDIGTSAMKN